MFNKNRKEYNDGKDISNIKKSSKFYTVRNVNI